MPQNWVYKNWVYFVLIKKGGECNMHTVTIRMLLLPVVPASLYIDSYNQQRLHVLKV